VRAALERLRTAGEPELGVIQPAESPVYQVPHVPPEAAAPVAAATAAPEAAPAAPVSAAEIEYVVNELTDEGYEVDRDAVERVLTLSHAFADLSALSEGKQS
jgi:hypothetical protein